MMRLHRIMPLIAAFACAAALLSVAGGVTYAVFDQQQTDLALCENAVDNRDAIRNTWNAARIYINRDQTDPDARARTNAFFDAVLLPIPSLECVGNQPVPKEES